MSLMMTSAQGRRNQMRPSKMLLTKKLGRDEDDQQDHVRPGVLAELL